MSLIDPYIIFVFIGGMIVLSYLFNIIANRFHLPSVLLLISAGIVLGLIGESVNFVIPNSSFLLKSLGILGLVFIVFEATLNLELTPEKKNVIFRSFAVALFALIITTAIISIILMFALEIDLYVAVIYAIPLSIISSAIAIPSVASLHPRIREFIVYESSFSDILGVMAFNYMLEDSVFTLQAFGNFSIKLLLIVILSAVSSLALLYMLYKVKSQGKILLIISVFITLYATGKLLHLPSLLLVLVLGLLFNNLRFIREKIFEWIPLEVINPNLVEVKLIVAELSFAIRTFFFILFGYAIELDLLYDYTVVVIGMVIVSVIFIIRFALLKMQFASESFSNELYVAPRGLITIILFYSIPEQFKTAVFNDGIVYFVILLTILIVMIGIRLSERTYVENI